MRRSAQYSLSAIEKGWKLFAREKPFFVLAFSVSLLFYLFLSGNVPYGIDDWQWGSRAGLEHLIHADLNSRYAGNLLEVAVSRSRALKTLTMGIMEAMLPFLSVVLIQRWCRIVLNQESDDRSLAVQLILANLVYLTLPLEVWRQTYGWVAGFSNYGFAALLLILCQGILLDGMQPGKKYPTGYLILCMLIGVCTQLVLENITVFVLLMTVAAVSVQLFRSKRCSSVYLALLVGVSIGTFIMFSGTVYSTLLVTGHTSGVGRSLSFPLDMSIPELIPFFYYRFLYFMPGYLWGDNWLACAVIALCAADLALSERKGMRFRKPAFTICLAFSLYFILNRFIGPLERYVSRWSDVLTQRVHFLFFLILLVLIPVLFRREKRTARMLLILWFAGMLVLCPMLAVTTIGGRCFLPAVVFLGQFCILLFRLTMRSQPKNLKTGCSAALLALLLLSMMHLSIVFGGLGRAEKQRENLISSAKEERKQTLYLPDYPFEEYHWITEPMKGGGQLSFFREYYVIPDEMELVFDPVD